jgi:hypothetical protein
LSYEIKADRDGPTAAFGGGAPLIPLVGASGSTAAVYPVEVDGTTFDLIGTCP